jgi:ferredoxin
MDVAARFLDKSGIKALIAQLQGEGYRCFGPREQHGAIVFDELSGAEDLPRGVIDDQQPGAYRLRHTDNGFYFAHTTCAQGIKPYLFAPHEPLWQSVRDEQGTLQFRSCHPPQRPIALIGPRACDLQAMVIQDRHFLESGRTDPYYQARRAQLFIVGVQCTRSGASCFCNSTGDGPYIQQGDDLRLTETDAGFVVQAGSERGARLMEALPVREVDAAQLAQAEARVDQAAIQQRALPSVNLEGALFNNLDHPRWQEVAKRCLSCANCTSVCPTCFCYREEDEAALAGDESARVRQWDSCFTQPHSYIHGITIRAETPQRYRQWLTHKLGSWHSQYGRSGCTGCGRCITWCPTGIDITEEANVICADESA